MRFFVDMDGTLAKWNNVEFEQLFEKGYYRHLEPNRDILDEIKTLIKQGEDIYILSCVLPESKYALDEKKEWLKEFLPELNKDKYIFVPYGQNKADYLKERYSPITSSDYLIDDYTKNLLEWKEYGGTGVKYLNGINHTRGTWQGLVIYAQKSNTIPVTDKNTSLINLINSEKLKKFTIECSVTKEGEEPEFEGGYVIAENKEKAITQAMNIDIEKNRQKGYIVEVNKRKDIITVLDGNRKIAEYKNYNAIEEIKLEKSNNKKLLQMTQKLNSKETSVTISRKQIKNNAKKISEKGSKQKQPTKSKGLEI